MKWKCNECKQMCDGQPVVRTQPLPEGKTSYDWICQSCALKKPCNRVLVVHSFTDVETDYKQTKPL